MTIDPWAQYLAIVAEIAETPVCDHVYRPGGPRRGCAWCELTEAAARYENLAARQAGRPVPNVAGMAG